MNNANGYIDIHAHILPGVDDGSGSMEETIRMLKIALEQGIGTIIATPHYIAGAKNTPTEQLQNIRDEVQSEAEKLDKNLKILLGNELYYSDSILEALKTKEALTLAGSRYVLVEFSVGEDYKTLYRGLGDLVRAGYAPVLAHVERYASLYKRDDLMNELIESGCYIQMNSSSLIGGILDFDAAYHRKLFKQGMIHFIGSDCHDQKIRIPKMRLAAEAVQKKNDEASVNKVFFENPNNILANTYI